MRADHHSPTDGTDAHWEWRYPLLPARKWRPGGPGRPPCAGRRMVNGLLSVNKTGGQWRLVPQALGHWRTIAGYCKRWRRDGVGARGLETLRQWERRCLGRPPAPAAGSMDSPSIKTATPNTDIGFDGHKQIPGRKRHLLVDTLGLLMAVVVTEAGTDERLGRVELLTQYFAEGVKRLRTLWVAGASPAAWRDEWGHGVQQTDKIDLEATPHTEGKGFHVVPWRWALERPFAWRLNARRQSRD